MRGDCNHIEGVSMYTLIYTGSKLYNSKKVLNEVYENIMIDSLENILFFITDNLDGKKLLPNETRNLKHVRVLKRKQKIYYTFVYIDIYRGVQSHIFTIMKLDDLENDKKKFMME